MEALKYWEKIDDKERPEVIRRLHESIKACRSIDRKHRDLVTWLNQRGWEDDYGATIAAWKPGARIQTETHEEALARTNNAMKKLGL
jgi:hypothetical protein